MASESESGVVTAETDPAAAPGEGRRTTTVTAVNGNPAAPSRLAHALAALTSRMAGLGCRTNTMDLRGIAPALLLSPPGRTTPRAGWRSTDAADLVILGSPIYKSAYSGLLKCWLDHLPRNGFRGKLVLPVATCHDGRDAAAFTEGLRHVCASLGAAGILPTVTLPPPASDPLQPPRPAVTARLESAVRGAVTALAEHHLWQPASGPSVLLPSESDPSKEEKCRS